MYTIRGAGFVFLNLPVETVQTFSLLSRSARGVVNRTNSTLDKLFPPKAYPLPQPIRNASLADNIMGEETLDVKLASDVKVLEGLSALIHVKLDAALSASKSGKYTYRLKDALQDSVDVLELDKYISQNPLTDSVFTFEKMLMEDDIFIVTEVIKSRSFEITYDAAGDINAGINADVDKFATINAQADKSKTKKQTESYNGEKYLAIAVKAVQLLYVKPFWKTKKEAKYRIEPTPVLQEVKGPEDMECILLDSAETINVEV